MVVNQQNVLLFVPNIIGYCRFFIIVVAYTQWETPNVFISLFTISGGLDFIDGAIARRLGQTSAFGAWFDVVIDNISRSMVWGRLMPSLGFAISSLEWLTFVCTHQIGKEWKTPVPYQPWFIAKVMLNNFNTPLGLWVIISVWFLPAWLYAMKYYHMVYNWLNLLVTIVFISGRLMAFAAECWFIFQHISILMKDK